MCNDYPSWAQNCKVYLKSNFGSLHIFICISIAVVEKELAECVGDKSRLHKLYLWSLQQYILILLALGRIDKAKKFIDQVTFLSFSKLMSPNSIHAFAMDCVHMFM